MRSFEEIERLIDEEKNICQKEGHSPCLITEEESYFFCIETAKRKIQKAYAAGDMQKVADIINFSGNWMHISQYLLLTYSPLFKEPARLFDLIIDVYTNDGYFFPKSLIQKAKKIAPQIPEEHRLKGLPAGDTITVWRGETYIPKPMELRKAISWTTDKNMAIWFAYRIDGKNGTVWEATIDRNKIIAFVQDREESEVLQHMNVQHPRMLEISEEERAAAFKSQQEKCNKQSEAKYSFPTNIE